MTAGSAPEAGDAVSAGTRLRAADGAEIIVTRAPASGTAVLRYDGQPLAGAATASSAADGSEAAAAEGGLLLGKRYEHPASGLEVLVVRPGPGTLTVNGDAVLVKGSKRLPSSD